MKEFKHTLNGQRIPDWIIWQTSKVARLRFWFLASRFNAFNLSLVFLAVGSMFSVIVLGIAARFVSWNLIFPSLGPTIFLQFYSPGSTMSCPRNTVLGHLVGALTGVLFFWIGSSLGIISGSTEPDGLLLAGLALGAGGTLMAFTRLLHPPAASTILIGALGMVEKAEDMLAIVFSAVILSLLAWVVHKMAGVRFPMWGPLEEDDGPRMETRLGKLSLDKKGRPETMADTAARLASRQRLK